MPMISSTTHPERILLLAAVLLVSCTRDSLAPAGPRLPTEFPPGFAAPRDWLTGEPLQGWGGGQGSLTHTPLVFVHGNGHTAANWIPLATCFAEAGYSWNELWAVSYLQLTSDSLYNTNTGNWRDIDDFVQAVLDYTGQEKVALIAHSLGVTVARAWLKHSADYTQVETFAGIAGANHGVSFCGPTNAQLMCAELGHPESAFLRWLNGEDETPYSDSIKYLTVYNGTDLDMFFIREAVMNDGSVRDLRLSPVLDGAVNIQFPVLDHFQLATAEVVCDTILYYLNLYQ